jgi:hypothetical protein
VAHVVVLVPLLLMGAIGQTERYACLHAGAIAVNLLSFFRISENRNVT